ncbi:MAG: M48 family metallopeptidase [Desulfuromusa sp.]|nr:M48 family metallopeptidase [Desulfuromusa sp.]
MNLDYTVIFSSRRKKLTITVERDRSVVVRAPEGMDLEKIHQVVASRKPWIFAKTRHPQKQGELPPPPGKELVSGESMPYLGRHYRLEITPGDVGAIRFLNKFKVSKAADSNLKDLFCRWYKDKARQKIPERVKRHAQALGVAVNQVKILELKYRWGSCTPKNNLNFNWRLIMAPVFVIDYVIIHELAHILEHNHSEAFWNIVKAQIPTYEKAKVWLAEHGEYLMHY